MKMKILLVLILCFTIYHNAESRSTIERELEKMGINSNDGDNEQETSNSDYADYDDEDENDTDDAYNVKETKQTNMAVRKTPTDSPVTKSVTAPSTTGNLSTVSVHQVTSITKQPVTTAGKHVRSLVSADAQDHVLNENGGDDMAAINTGKRAPLSKQDRADLLRIKSAAERIEAELNDLDIAGRASDTELDTQQHGFEGNVGSFGETDRGQPNTTDYVQTTPMISVRDKNDTGFDKKGPGRANISTNEQTTHLPPTFVPGAYQGFSPFETPVTSENNHQMDSKQKPKLTPVNAHAHAVGARSSHDAGGRGAHAFDNGEAAGGANVQTKSPLMSEVGSLVLQTNRILKQLAKSSKQLADQNTDNTNMEIADIKENSDKISQLQQAMIAQFTDVKNTLSVLLSSQTEMRQTMTTTFENMINALRDITRMFVLKVKTKERKNTKGKETTSDNAQTTQPTKTLPTKTKTPPAETPPVVTQMGSKKKPTQTAGSDTQAIINREAASPTEGTQSALNDSSFSKTLDAAKRAIKEDDLTSTLEYILAITKRIRMRLDENALRFGDQNTDYKNMERSDIKENSDKIDKLQDEMLGQFSDVKKNISLLMTSQTEMSGTMTTVFGNMMKALREIIRIFVLESNAHEAVQMNVHLNKIRQMKKHQKNRIHLQKLLMKQNDRVSHRKGSKARVNVKKVKQMYDNQEHRNNQQKPLITDVQQNEIKKGSSVKETISKSTVDKTTHTAGVQNKTTQKPVVKEINSVGHPQTTQAPVINSGHTQKHSDKKVAENVHITTLKPKSTTKSRRQRKLSDEEIESEYADEDYYE